MIDINIIELTLTMIIAYFIVTTLTGCFAAWVAQALGDHTAQYAGLLTLNPIAHIDPIGFTLLIVLGFGWGRNVPINPYFIEEPHQKFKTIVAYYATAFAHVFLSLTSLLLLLKAFGIEILALSKAMILKGQINLPLLAKYYPDYSSFILVLGLILVAVIYLSTLLAAIDFLLSSFRLVLLFFTDLQAQDDFLLFIIPMFIIYFFFLPPLRKGLMLIVMQFAQFLFKFIG